EQQRAGNYRNPVVVEARLDGLEKRAEKRHGREHRRQRTESKPSELLAAERDPGPQEASGNPADEGVRDGRRHRLLPIPREPRASERLSDDQAGRASEGHNPPKASPGAGPDPKE